MKFIIFYNSLQCPRPIILVHIRVVDHIDEISARLLLQKPVSVSKQLSIHRVSRLRHKVQFYHIPVLSENP